MTTTAEPARADVRLLLSVERDSYGGGYFHPHARPVRIEHDTDGTKHVRNCSDSWGEPARELADFTITAQGNAEDNGGQLYGFHAEYRNVYSVDLDRAKRMAKLLGRLERGLAKLDSELGYIDAANGNVAYAQFLARVAKVLGITRFGFRASGESGWHDRNSYEWVDAAYLATYVEREIKRVLEPVR